MTNILSITFIIWICFTGMAGQTMAQKIFESHADVADPVPGEHVTVEPDWILAHDLSTYSGKKRMEELGFESVAHPERILVVVDHHVPPKNEEISNNLNEVKKWIKKQGIEHFYPPGSGISHNVIAEEGYVVPGSLILGADSHTTTHGAYGAFATGIGSTDLGKILGTGKLWLKVPESRRVCVDNTLNKGSTAKDLSLRIMEKLTAKGAIYESIEYHGEGIRDLSVHERRTLSNLAVELGAMAGMVPPDSTTREYLDGRARIGFDEVSPDGDASYVDEVHIDANNVEPVVSRPSRVDNIAKVTDCEGVDVDQVFLGSCNNSSYEDIKHFAGLLSGNRVASETKLIVVPGSRSVLQQMNKKGVSNTILDAGGMIGTPGCGPCFGGHGGILADGEICIATMNRNFPGRMGPGEIYLASPLTAAAAAIYGEITDPREVI